MALIEWGPRLQVGHATIDEQHKALVDTINQLDAAVTAGKPGVELEAILTFLKGHAESHFLTDGGVFRSLQQLASADLLTSAWNRRHYEEAVAGEIHRSHRYGHPVSVLMLDIDHFKRVNDAFGHTVGDQVLQQVAALIRSTIRVSDSLTRWGGEEFIVLMPNTGVTSAVTLAERIRERLAAHDFTGVGQVTASLGVAEYLTSESPEAWLERADRAMYRAKANGRNRIEVDHLRDQARSATEHLGATFLKLVWDDTYRCGNAQIDRQHEELFQRSNELLDALLSGRPVDEVSELVAGLIAAVVQHFHDEEAILAEIGFPGLAAHKDLHAALVQKAVALDQAFRGGTLSLGALFQFLASDVVASHMLKADREFFSLTAAR